MLAGAGGLVVFVCMFLPWFDGSLAGRGVSKVEVDTITGWEAFGSFFDLVIIVLAAVPIAIVVWRASAPPSGLPAEPSTLVLGAGALLLAVLLWRVLDPPDLFDVPLPDLETDISRNPAAFAAPLAALVVMVGGWAQGRERALAERRRAQP